MSRRILTASGRARFTALAMCLALIAAAFALTSSAQVVGNPVVGTPTLQVARQGHTATLLASGKVLIVGGEATGSAELFDPTTQSFSSLTALLGTPRMFHAAVLLQSGQVLIVGGIGSDNSALNSAELFDPTTQSFSAVGNTMQVARVLPTLRVLPDGKVQVIGGSQDNSMEIFDPAEASFGAYA